MQVPGFSSFFGNRIGSDCVESYNSAVVADSGR
jgi:hypothetical protein